MPDPRNDTARPLARSGGGQSAARASAQRDSTASPLDALLARLERVHRCGRGYRADCPVGHKSRGTLSLAEGENESVVLHCFVCMSASAVLDALGMTLADLYPARRDIRDMTPEERRQMRQGAREAQWMAALSMLAFESTIVQIAGRELLRGLALSPDDHQRLAEACERIDRAREVLRAR